MLIVVFALCGLSLAVFIHYKKRLHVPLVCPIGHSCDPVVHSRYSRFMDVPVELLGVLYYALIVAAYSLSLMYPALYEGTTALFLLGLSALAFLFSLYLTFVQAFMLREWCTWCLISAALCAGIFVTALSFGGAAL